MRLQVVVALFTFMFPAAVLSQNTLAPTPPMGWNSWNHFAGKVTDADVRATADQMVKTGMRDAGYVYVNIDDTWQGQRDAKGTIHSNHRFPDMKALSAYVHSRGLKLGIYSSPGEQTCAGYAGSYGHEVQDAQTYASWDVDFLKYDLCSFGKQMDAERKSHPNAPELAAKEAMIAAYKKMGDALRATGRPILYSLCQYGFDDVWQWGPSVGASMWRTTGDINDSYTRMDTIGQSQSDLAPFAGPGHWNDPDMLEVGNGGMNTPEYQSHMSLWALLAAPLLAGNDLTNMSEADRKILLNHEVIAIDQDAPGKQGSRLYQYGEINVWTKPMSGNRVAVGLFNTDCCSSRNISVDFAKIGMHNGAQVRDVWGAKELGHHTGVFTSNVGRHGVLLLMLTPAKPGE